MATFPRSSAVGFRAAEIALACILAAACAERAAPPTPPALLELRVLATDPAAPRVLSTADRLQLRIGYRSDQPIRVWAQPFSGGNRVAGGNNPSPAWPAGDGEALAWFFLFDAGDVDEVRVYAGDAAGRQSFAEISVPVDIRFERRAASEHAPAEWIAELEERAADIAAATPVPPAGPLDDVLGLAIILVVFAVLIAALVVPARAAVRWHGGWRLAACIAVLLMVLPALNVIIGTAIDPTSHNLWPLELLQFALASLALIAVLALLRRRFA